MKRKIDEIKKIFIFTTKNPMNEDQMQYFAKLF